MLGHVQPKANVRTKENVQWQAPVASRRKRLTPGVHFLQSFAKFVKVKLLCSQISSKDAYMLVYAKKWSPALPCNGSTEHEGPSALKVHGSRSQEVMKETCSPPSRVMEYISALNAAHDDACEKYLTK